MSSLQSDILMLSVAYALVGALLLVVLVYARLPWSLKAVAVVVTSSFYIASFLGMRGLLGWASVDRLPPSFKLLQARIVEPHSLEGDPGAIYLWVETLDEGSRPSGVPRAYRIPYSDKLADKTDKAQSEIAAGRAQGGRAADYGSGEGGLLELGARLHHAEYHHRNLRRRSLHRRRADGSATGRRRSNVYAAPAAADAAQGRHGAAGKQAVTEAKRATQSCCLIFLKRRVEWI